MLTSSPVVIEAVAGGIKRKSCRTSSPIKPEGTCENGCKSLRHKVAEGGTRKSGGKTPDLPAFSQEGGAESGAVAARTLNYWDDRPGFGDSQCRLAVASGRRLGTHLVQSEARRQHCTASDPPETPREGRHGVRVDR